LLNILNIGPLNSRSGWLFMTLEELATQPGFNDIAEIIRTERGRRNLGEASDDV
jgi:hypothetical protein